VYVPLGDELEERIRGAAAERALPDLAILSGTRLAQELAEQGLLLPLHRIEQEADEPFAGPAAIVTGDQVVMFRYSRVSEDLMSYLVTEEAIETLTSFGLPTLAGDVDPSIYPDPTMRWRSPASGTPWTTATTCPTSCPRSSSRSRARVCCRSSRSSSGIPATSWASPSVWSRRKAGLSRLASSISGLDLPPA
jgi:hypothetical protein